MFRVSLGEILIIVVTIIIFSMGMRIFRGSRK